MSDEAKIIVKYLSRYASLRIVRKSAVTREVNGQNVTTPGESIRFVEGVFETDDKETQDFIEARPEFSKGLIIKVPGNVKDILANRAEWMKDLETKDLEAELAKRKKGEDQAKADIKGSVSGAGAEGDELKKDTGAAEGDGLEAKKVKELVEIATNEGVSADVVEKFTKPGAKKVELVDIIRENRKEAEEKGGSFN